jgi:hypothetical protein
MAERHGYYAGDADKWIVDFLSTEADASLLSPRFTVGHVTRASADRPRTGAVSGGSSRNSAWHALRDCSSCVIATPEVAKHRILFGSI